MQMSANNTIWNSSMKERNFCNPGRNVLPANVILNSQIL